MGQTDGRIAVSLDAPPTAGHKTACFSRSYIYTDVEVVGELVEFVVRVDGVLATETSSAHIIAPRFHAAQPVPGSARLVDGGRQALAVPASRVRHGRPARPQRPDVGLQVPREGGLGVRPQHRRDRDDAVDRRLHRRDVVLHALRTAAQHSSSLFILSR